MSSPDDGLHQLIDGTAVWWDGGDTLWWHPGLRFHRTTRGIDLQLDERVGSTVTGRAARQLSGATAWLCRHLRSTWPPPLRYQPVIASLVESLQGERGLAPVVADIVLPHWDGRWLLVERITDEADVDDADGSPPALPIVISERERLAELAEVGVQIERSWALGVDGRGDEIRLFTVTLEPAADGRRDAASWDALEGAFLAAMALSRVTGFDHKVIADLRGVAVSLRLHAVDGSDD